MIGLDKIKIAKDRYAAELHQVQVNHYAAGLAFEDLARELVNYKCGEERYIKNNDINVKAIDIRDVYGRYVEVKSSGWCRSGIFRTPVIYIGSSTTPDIFDKQLAEIWYGYKDKLYRYAAKDLQEFLKSCIAANKNLRYYDYEEDGHKGYAAHIELKELKPYEIAVYDIEKEVRDENKIR